MEPVSLCLRVGAVAIAVGLGCLLSSDPVALADDGSPGSSGASEPSQPGSKAARHRQVSAAQSDRDEAATGNATVQAPSPLRGTHSTVHVRSAVNRPSPTLRNLRSEGTAADDGGETAPSRVEPTELSGVEPLQAGGGDTTSVIGSANGPLAAIPNAAAVPMSSTTTAAPAATFSGLLASGLTPGSGNGAVPTTNGSLLAGILAWVRREIDSLFFNKTPTANPVQISQTGDGVVSGTLNAADDNEDPLAFKVTTNPLHGTVLVDSNGLYTYSADPAFAEEGGTDSFVVQVRDTGFHLNFWVPSSISVTVPVSVASNEVPVEVAPTTVYAPSRWTGLVSGAVHVSDPNENPLVYTVSTAPEKGSVTVDELGDFVYKPTEAAREAASARNAPAEAKNDFFVVTASDGASSVAVPVSVPVAPFNDTKIDTIDVGGFPQAVAFSPDGSRAYTANLGGTITVVDTTSRTAVNNFVVENQPDGLAISPDGTKLFVAQSASNSVSLIDAVSGDPVGQPIVVGASPGPIVVHPTGDFIYVANTNSNDISVIATGDRSVSNIAVGASPDALAISEDGSRVYVANFGDGSVSVIDTASKAVVGEAISVIGNPSALALSADGQTLYVTDFLNGSLYFIDLTDLSRHAVTVGGNPDAVIASADGTRVYVANSGDNTVSVVDTSIKKLLSTIDVGTAPAAVAFNPAGTELYVANSNDGSVTDISVVQNLTDTLNSTEHFEIYNHSSHAVVYQGASQGGEYIDSGPAVGTVVDIGGSVGFEITYRFLRSTFAQPYFRAVDTGAFYYQSLEVGPYDGTGSACSTSGTGTTCAAGGTGIYLLDTPGTVVTIPHGPDEYSPEQEAFLRKYCRSDSPMHCTFDGTSEVRTNREEHSTGIIVQNGGPTKIEYSHTAGYAATSSDNITVGGSLGGEIKEIVSVEIHAEYSHEWGEEHTWEHSLSIPIKPGWQAEIMISDPVYENNGNFVLTMGNTTWQLTGATFTSPDWTGTGVAVWRVEQSKCATPTCH